MKFIFTGTGGTIIPIGNGPSAGSSSMTESAHGEPPIATNVVFLKALPISMRSVNHGPLDRKTQERLNLELNCFCVSLLFNGRPGKERFVKVVRGQTLQDLIDYGVSIKLSPWHETKDNPFPNLKVYEVHGVDVSGWWAEIDAGVLAYLSFSGLYGLKAHDIACLLAESQFPDPLLIEWANNALLDNKLAIDDAAAAIPEEARQYLGVNFRTGLRTLRLANDSGTTDNVLFSAYEYDVELTPVFS